MNRLALFALLCGSLLALGCPKNAVTHVAGSDDEQVDQYSAQLEELRTEVQATPPACDGWCSRSRKVCDISKALCEIAGRNGDRADLQKKCTDSQEDCAQFNDRCTSCSK